MAKLLLIEDDTFLLEALKEVLSDMGHRVNALESAEAALAVLEDTSEQLPDIIITDIRLPGISGLDLLTKARNHPLWKNIPFICMSANMPPAMEAIIAQQPNVNFVRKPFEVDELFATVNRALNQ